MKNKLTTEELKLQSKLNEAEFAYQEGHWIEMEQMVSQKSVWAKYGSIFKAVVAFVVIVGSVVLLKELYSNEQLESTAAAPKEIIQTQEVSSTSNSETSSEESNLDQVVTSTNNEKLEKKDALVEIPSSVEVKQKIEQLNSKELELVQEPKLENQTSTPHDANNKESSAIDYSSIKVDLLYVELESAPCLNEELQVKAILKEPLTETDVYFKWYLNSVEIEGNGIHNSLLINSTGEKQIVVKALINDRVLSEGKNNFNVETKVDLSFTAKDLDDIFYDQNVNLKVNQPSEGSYRWYSNKSERIQFGSETAWGFINEGRYSMTLEHISPNGCINTATQFVEMEKDFIDAFPNSFTPDNDGHNDIFVLTTLQGYNFKSFELNVLDSKGQAVFQTNDPYEGWNGRVSNTGNVLPNGNYAWIVRIENNNGHKRTFKGKIKTIDF